MLMLVPRTNTTSQRRCHEKIRSGWAVRMVYMALLMLTQQAQAATPKDSICPTAQMQVKRLPDLNIPRLGHSVLCIGGEVLVAGGHTTGFVPTPTAEYYADGQWHLVPMTYPHDQGVAAITANGEVLLAGGHEKELGIGQTFTLERYTPATHTFKGYGCLATKRCFAKALPIDSASLVISGNWYADDCIELYDGSRQNKLVKPVAQHRSMPYILPTAPDRSADGCLQGKNAIIFSSHDHHGQPFDTIVIDRLRGEPFTVPLFQAWRPFWSQVGFGNMRDSFIGDEVKGEYASLIRLTQGDSLMAIARVEGESFALLPTATPIPMRSQWGRIDWFSYIVADRRVGRAYVVGYGEDEGDHRLYVLAIDYKGVPTPPNAQHPTPITLYYSEPQDCVGRYQPVLTPDGDLMLVGGIVAHNNNYDASATVLLLRVGSGQSAAQTASPSRPWPIVAAFLLVLLIAAILIRRRPTPAPLLTPLGGKTRRGTSSPQGGIKGGLSDADLMERICRYMEEQQPYLDSELKMQDVADALDTNRTYISNCIKSQRGYSFSQFVNTYRVEHAQRLLRQHPDKKVSEIWSSSGFSTESSFFRAFKAVTGTTPRAVVGREQST